MVESWNTCQLVGMQNNDNNGGKPVPGNGELNNWKAEFYERIGFVNGWWRVMNIAGIKPATLIKFREI